MLKWHGGGQNQPKRYTRSIRTIPIVLKDGNKRMLVNCFLDDGSDTTYINEDIVEELGLQRQKQKITINIANGQQVSFDSMTFTIGLESMDRNIDTTIEAKASERICGGMKLVNWVNIQHQWTHLRDILFLEPPIKTTYQEERTTRFHYTYCASITEEPCIPGQKSEDLSALVKKF